MDSTYGTDGTSTEAHAYSTSSSQSENQCSYYPRKDMFLWKVAGIQVSLQACHGLLQEMGRYVIPL